MALCFIGIHSWDACKCANCGKQRNEEHVWDGGKCKICGKPTPKQGRNAGGELTPEEEAFLKRNEAMKQEAAKKKQDIKDTFIQTAKSWKPASDRFVSELARRLNATVGTGRETLYDQDSANQMQYQWYYTLSCNDKPIGGYSDNVSFCVWQYRGQPCVNCCGGQHRFWSVDELFAGLDEIFDAACAKKFGTSR